MGRRIHACNHRNAHPSHYYEYKSITGRVKVTISTDCHKYIAIIADASIEHENWPDCSRSFWGHGCRIVMGRSNTAQAHMKLGILNT